MTVLRILTVVGARPNFMKLAPLEREFRKFREIEPVTVHTGQHYDHDMSDVFFDQLGLAPPAVFLGVGSGGHGEMTGKIMIEFEKTCKELAPALVVVVGDVNSTIAGALTARKLGIPVAHVEAGLRSFDETMPEELNRRLTDCLSNLLFVSEPSGSVNLAREGIDPHRVHLVGDIMLETLQLFLPLIESARMWEKFDLTPGAYALVTAHRPSNVDDVPALTQVVEIIESIEYPVIFPIHPRTVRKLDESGLGKRLARAGHVIPTPPMPYVEFLSLLKSSALTFSDSGSIQSEAAFFDVPCLVMRENTERPFYIQEGTSTLTGRDRALISHALGEIRQGVYKRSTGAIKNAGSQVAQRTVQVISDFLQEGRHEA